MFGAAGFVAVVSYPKEFVGGGGGAASMLLFSVVTWIAGRKREAGFQ
jgi:hypothetical protein